MVSVLKVHWQKESNTDRVADTQNLLDIMESEVRPLVHNAQQCLQTAKRGPPKKLPTSKEIERLKKHLDAVLSTTSQNNENERDLMEAVLAYLILFNKRRSGEASKITI